MNVRTTFAAAASALLLIVGLAGCSAIGDAVGGVVDVDGDTSAFEAKVGDCINDAEATASEEVANVTIVECTVAHDYEAYHSITMPDGAFPGASAVETAADDGCVAEFENFVGTTYEESTLSITYFTPTSASWDEDDREILCMIVDAGEDGETIPSSVSLEGSNR